MPDTPNSNPFTLNKETSQILLNNQDVTEQVIEVLTQWFLHTDLFIGLCNSKTNQQYVITCILIDETDTPNLPVIH